MEVGRLNQSVIAALADHPDVKERQRVVAETVRADAVQLAPVLSGTLRRGIATEDVPAEQGVEVRVGWTRAAYYGAIVELGSEDTPAQAHLRPAALKVGGRRAVPD